MEFWRQFEQELLDGQFRLSKYWGTSENCAIFLSRLSGDEQQRVTVKIMAAAGPQAQHFVSSWNLAKGLQNPNLVHVYESASTTLGGLRVVYAVMDYAEETLEHILEERCLTEAEARELLLCSAQALCYLHSHGIVLAHMVPSALVAVENSTKLSVDHLHRGDVSTADDISGLGATVLKALTGRLAAPEHCALVSSLPAPFCDILPHCLELDARNRWTADELIAALGRSGSAASGSRRLRVANWKFASVAVVLLSSAAWLASLVVHRSGPLAPKPVPSSMSVSAAPMEGAAVVERRRLREVPLTPPKITAEPLNSRKARATWRVVVYKDSNVAKANRKADAINEIWPDLNAAVFSLTGEPPFEVVLGGTMQHAAARKLTKRLKARGLPEATPVKTLSR
jgi:hypothetical protein